MLLGIDHGQLFETCPVEQAGSHHDGLVGTRP